MTRCNQGNIVWSSQEAAVVTGGQNSCPWKATGIAMTLEDLQPGDLFVAAPGDDLDQVFKKGAAAAMVACSGGCSSTAVDHPHLPILSVAGTYEALKSLARAARFRTHSTVIAVQGRRARQEIETTLERAGRVHGAQRHLSMDLAGLPLDADYGVFGASPAVQPDIAIITDPQSANRDTMFESMSPHNVVLIYGDDREASLSVVARAKAAGIGHVYTYGAQERCDAQIVSVLDAENGARVTISMLGEAYSFMIGAGDVFAESMLAALLVMQLTDKCVHSAMQAKESIAPASVDGAVLLIDPAQNSREEAAFRITNMIDLGPAGQTAVLDNIAKVKGHTQRSALSLKKGFAIPPRLANLNFVYTSKGKGTLNNAKAVIQERHKGAQVESIPPDILMPGDFLVFKDVWDSSKAALSEALRVIPKGRKTIKNAV